MHRAKRGFLLEIVCQRAAMRFEQIMQLVDFFVVRLWGLAFRLTRWCVGRLCRLFGFRLVRWARKLLRHTLKLACPIFICILIGHTGFSLLWLRMEVSITKGI
jgi:hypothetical protein